MGVRLSKSEAAKRFAQWTEKYDVYAPMLMEGEGCFSDTDVIRYGKVSSLDDIVWDKKSDYSFKETLLPINETLFYYTEDQTTVPKGPQKGLLIFLRSCDLHAVKRLDDIYLNNKFETQEGIPCDVTPDYVTENIEKVTLPKNLSNESFTKEIWQEYGDRCITCGRCNFACPTCTCFTMQDIFYKDNAKVGERRRVWASCQVDGYDEIAGGIGFRKTKGDRVRFKVMHKIYDFEKRFGYPMCVGCGRCDDICPEYISYSNLINRLAKEEIEQ